jgi:hypothetical protein
MNRSPLFIRIALFYHYSPEPWPANEMHDAQREVHFDQMDAGLIVLQDGKYVGVQEPLRLYAKALGAVPLPVNRWVMPEQL